MGRPKNFSREEVLQKSIPVFWKQGFADTSLQDLEKATGVNKSGLYSEFESKEDLFIESLKYYLSQRDGSVMLKEPLGWGNIRDFLAKSCPPDQLAGCLAVYSIRELSVVPNEAHALLSANQTKLKSIIAKNIEAAGSARQADLLAEVVLTFFIGLCLESNMGRRRAASLRKIDNFLAMLQTH